MVLRERETNSRVICKVRQTQHQNLEFGQNKVIVKKKLAKKNISIQHRVKRKKPSILVVN
jgi:hypothetical protein